MRYRVLRKPLLACSFVSRVETKQLLSVLRFFKQFIGGFETFLFFCFCRLLLLLCFGLHFAVLFVAFEFCDFGVSVNVTDQPLCFYFSL